jgi:uncharacterized membrane protein
MPFCASCGSLVEGKFCPKCGAAAGGSQSAPPPPPAAPAQGGEMSANVVATLCYIPVVIPSIVFLVLAPYNRDRTIRFHAFQSLFFQLAWLVVAIAAGIVLAMFSWSVSFLFSRLLNLAGLVIAIFMMYKSYQGQKVVLPVIGDLAEKQA